jgi:phospholipase C
MERFFEDVKGPVDDFPEYCLIEPTYFLTNSNDDHPPHSTMHAQCLTADVYNALRTSKLWDSLLFVVMYDEHGGFFDHVEPPPTDADKFTAEYKFDRLGVRVPAMLVSPWVKRGVLHMQFDHTSLLKYLTDKWELGPLSRRVAKANSIAEAIQSTSDPNRLPRIEDSQEMQQARQEQGVPDAVTNWNQLALIVFCQVLAVLLDNAGLPNILGVRAAMHDESAKIDAAKQAVNMFIEQEQQKAKLAVAQ